MRHELWLNCLGLALVLSSCAGSRVSSSSSASASDYNSYTEDLTAARPVYTSAPTSASGGTTTRPATVSATTGVATAPTRKNDTRKPTGVPEALHVNRQLELALDTIADKNRSVRYAPGFRVQVYVGNQRKEVESIKLLIYQNFPELSPYLSYSQPTYKLKVGDFMRRMDAERYYSSIKQLVSSAQLQPDKIDVRRSLLIK